MVERDRTVAAALRESARELGAAGAEIQEGDALAWLARSRESFDVVFLDPPFASDLAARALEALPPRLAPGARVYVESGEPLPAEVRGDWRMLREDRAGAVRYALLERATPP